MIYRYVFSECRSIRPVEINQYDITIPTYYDITIVNDIASDIHCEVTMSNDVALCTYHGITMHYNIAMNLFYYVLSALYQIALFYYR